MTIDQMRQWHLSLAVVSCLYAVGCGDGDTGLVRVTGRVTYEGRPVAGANVAFRGDGRSLPAIGVTDSDGEFSLTTAGKPGVTPGEHLVTVASFEVDGALPPEDVSMEDAGRGRTDVVTRALLPVRFASPSNTDLRYHVQAQETNHFEINLED